MTEPSARIWTDGLALVIDGLPDRGPIRLELNRRSAARIAFALARAVRAAPPEPGDDIVPEEIKLALMKEQGHA